jgi:hypothetical protein
MKEQLADGHRVVLDGFGYFHTGIKSVAVDHPADFKPEEHIKRVFTNFVPADSYDPTTHHVRRSFNDSIKFEELRENSSPKSKKNAKKP